MRHSYLKHQFVQYIPDHLEPGVLYISIEYGTAAHSCCCGCGEEVVTPITPTDWKITFDGETVSLWPSVGNWNLACRSHYVIKRGQVIGAEPWSAKRIMVERQRDKAAKAQYFGMYNVQKEVEPSKNTTSSSQAGTSLWSRVNHWLSRMRG